MKIVFMGTPDFAVPPLRALYYAGHEIVCVFTGEDKPKGRGYEMKPTPVKEEALKLGLPVFTPSKMKDLELYQQLQAYQVDVFVVVAYGKILPKEILEIPPKGCINIHASLLPEYRGAAPIQWAILDGKKKTGITTMLMDEGLDTGDILKQYEVDIEEGDTGGSLFTKLAILGAEAIVDTLQNLEQIVPQKQGETTTAYARRLEKEDGCIDFEKRGEYIERQLRAFDPWPGVYFTLEDGRKIRVYKVKNVGNIVEFKDNFTLFEYLLDGKIVIYNNKICILCKDALLEILELQLEGRKRMGISEFMKGFYPIRFGIKPDIK